MIVKTNDKMIDNLLATIIKKLATLYYKRTHFCVWTWGIDDRTDIAILSEEVMDGYTRYGLKDIPHTHSNEKSAL